MTKRVWQDRYDEIVKTFPSVENIDWGVAFRGDSSLFTSVVSDLVKAEGRGSLPGKRPSLSKEDAAKQLSKIAQSDFSDSDFYVTFRSLVGDRSVRAVAFKTGLGKSYIYQLLNEERFPSFAAMEKIAQGFGKDPSFFLEYRIAYIIYNIDRFLIESPEISTTWYIKIKKASKNVLRMS